jgi:hypothetical protein
MAVRALLHSPGILSLLGELMPMVWGTCGRPGLTMGGMLMDMPSKEFALAGTLGTARLIEPLSDHF